MRKIGEILRKLKEARPIFHSAHDFHFDLAWTIREEYKNAEIRFEYPAWNIKEGGRHIDLLVKLKNEIFPIVLKYKTKQLVVSVERLDFDSYTDKKRNGLISTIYDK